MELINALAGAGARVENIQACRSRFDGESGLAVRLGDGIPSAPLHAPVALAHFPFHLCTLDGNRLFLASQSNATLHSHLLAYHESTSFELDERRSLMVYLILVRLHVITDIEPWETAYMHVLAALQFHTPVFWSALGMQQLKGTPLYASTAAKQRRLEREVHMLWALFERLNPEVTVQEVYGLWQWADACFWSRVLDGSATHDAGNAMQNAEEDAMPFPQPRYRLVPVLDWCNHDSCPNTRWELTDTGVQLWVHGPHLADGEELLISYGEKSPAEFLFTYGFIPEDAMNMDTLSENVWLMERFFYALDLPDTCAETWPWKPVVELRLSDDSSSAFACLFASPLDFISMVAAHDVHILDEYETYANADDIVMAIQRTASWNPLRCKMIETLRKAVRREQSMLDPLASGSVMLSSEVPLEQRYAQFYRAFYSRFLQKWSQQLDEVK